MPGASGIPVVRARFCHKLGHVLSMLSRGQPSDGIVMISSAEKRIYHRCGLVALAVLLAVELFPGPSFADVDDENDVPATTELEKKENDRDLRRKGAIQDRQRRLKSDRQSLKFEKRTKHPFKSERTLRRDIRRNEQRQNWNKSEIRRLEHRNRRHRSGGR